MKLLLDTQIVLWWSQDSRRLRDAWRDAILQPSADVWVSVVTLWEIVLKVRTGKLKADVQEIKMALGEDGFRLLAILPNHLRALADLPAHHRDPFDHLLIAQAISEGATLVTDDRAMRNYLVELL